MLACVTEAYQIAGQNNSTSKLVKTKNVDVTLRCSLLEAHEEFNMNANVSWWFKKTCKSSCWNQPESDDDDEWTKVSCDGACKTSLDLNDDTASNGFYLCKIFPYQVSNQTILQIEVTKTFQLEIIGELKQKVKRNIFEKSFKPSIVDPMMLPPPEIVDGPNQFNVKFPQTQLVLQCKCRSSQKPTIKWFKKKDESYLNSDDHKFESYKSFVETSRSIKYFENFYEPIMVSPGLKELSDNLYLSKLIVNNITQNSIYVCVTINYFGFSFRENFVNVENIDDDSLDFSDESVGDFPEKNFEILFLIPIVLLMPISVLICTILYLFINRQILRRNKNIEVI